MQPYRAKLSQGRVQIGKLAPEFTVDAVVDSNFKTISLSDYRGKYVVLFFYPLDLFVYLNLNFEISYYF